MTAKPSPTSPWFTRQPDVRRYEPLSGGLTVDAVVVGGGIAGVSAMYFLQRAGKRVALIEANHLGTGETGFTTAFLIAAVDPPLARLGEQFGTEHLRTVWHAGTETIGLIEHTAAAESIACDFRRLDAYEVALQPQDLPHLEEERRAIETAGGEATLCSAEEARSALGVPAAGALRIPQQGAFGVRAFLLGLAERVVAAGGQMFEETRMARLDAGSSVTVHTSRGTITAAHVVLATGLFPNPYRAQNALLRQLVTYVIALGYQTTGHQWRLPDALYSDLAEPFHYMRFVNDLFLVGGEDRPVRDAANAGEAPHAALEAFARTFVPDTDWTVTHAWRGQILETADALPVVGVPPGGLPAVASSSRRSLGEVGAKAGDQRILLASGFGGNGMTLGVLSGKTVADLATGVLRPGDNPFRFDRPTLKLKS